MPIIYVIVCFYKCINWGNVHILTVVCDAVDAINDAIKSETYLLLIMALYFNTIYMPSVLVQSHQIRFMLF